MEGYLLKKCSEAGKMSGWKAFHFQPDITLKVHHIHSTAGEQMEVAEMVWGEVLNGHLFSLHHDQRDDQSP